ncbi:MAG: hypothetical protein KKH52_02075 [Nanoarchaeota archaeon]|nr:hypothetical protein [Nanoarchaeota archaeon]MBU1622425.1 hypothetical protein [Nanoarchaeota archaeon]MBU1974159.1 hypothetical protein [Nanoarchaeota archaeon]
MPFQQLKQEYLKCTNCPELVQNRTQIVFGSGNEKAKISACCNYLPKLFSSHFKYY